MKYVSSEYLWYRLAKFLYRFEGFKDALDTVLDESLGDMISSWE